MSENETNTLVKPKLDNFELDINNIGGISKQHVTVLPGINIYQAPNAKGKTSLMRAMMLLATHNTVDKSYDYILKSNENEGSVELTDSNNDVYTKHIKRYKGSKKESPKIEISGDEMFSGPESRLVKTFAIGDNHNKILQTLRSGADGKKLRDILLENSNIPILEEKVKNLNQEIEELDNSINQKNEELEKIGEPRKEIAKLENKKKNKQKNVAKLEKELEEIDEKLVNIEKPDEESESNNSLDVVKKQISEKESDKHQIESKIKDYKQQIEDIEKDKDAKEKSIEEIESKINEITISSSESKTDLYAEKEKYKNKRLYYNQKVNSLREIKNFAIEQLNKTENLISESGSNDVVGKGLGTGNDIQVKCPTCGTQKPKHDVQKHIDNIDEQINDFTNKSKEIGKYLEKLSSEINKHESAEAEYQKLKDKKETLKNRIEEYKNDKKSIENLLEERRDELKTIEEEINKLVNEKEQLVTKKSGEYKNLENKSKQKSQEIGQLKKEISDIENKINYYNNAFGKIDELKDEIAKLDSRKKSLNSERASNQEKKRYAEHNFLEKFNENIDKVYEKLNFSNVAAINLDYYDPEHEKNVKSHNKQKTKKESSGKDAQYILRVSRDYGGINHNVSIKTLSTSELEVVGLTLMLSGYITFDVGETFPVMLFDEITYMDENRLNGIMEIMNKYANSIVLTTLPQTTINMGDKKSSLNMIEATG